MSETTAVALITLILILSAMSAFGFFRRLRRIQKLQAQAAAAQDPAMIYTIPTNAPGSAARPNTGSSILYPNRTTAYFAPSTDLPPSYEDVTKDSPVIVNLSTTEVTPSPTTTPIATTTTTTTAASS